MCRCIDGCGVVGDGERHVQCRGRGYFDAVSNVEADDARRVDHRRVRRIDQPLFGCNLVQVCGQGGAHDGGDRRRTSAVICVAQQPACAAPDEQHGQRCADDGSHGKPGPPSHAHPKLLGSRNDTTACPVPTLPAPSAAVAVSVSGVSPPAGPLDVI